MDINKGNELISEFMNIAVDNTDPFWFKDQHYHQSWDWLMPVVNKIDSILADDDFVTISYNRCLIEVHNTSWLFPDKDVNSLTIEGMGNTRIEATWKAICEFITWNNENN